MIDSNDFHQSMEKTAEYAKRASDSDIHYKAPEGLDSHGHFYTREFDDNFNAHEKKIPLQEAFTKASAYLATDLRRFGAEGQALHQEKTLMHHNFKQIALSNIVDFREKTSLIKEVFLCFLNIISPKSAFSSYLSEYRAYKEDVALYETLTKLELPDPKIFPANFLQQFNQSIFMIGGEKVSSPADLVEKLKHQGIPNDKIEELLLNCFDSHQTTTNLALGEQHQDFSPVFNIQLKAAPNNPKVSEIETYSLSLFIKNKNPTSDEIIEYKTAFNPDNEVATTSSNPVQGPESETRANYSEVFNAGQNDANVSDGLPPEDRAAFRTPYSIETTKTEGRPQIEGETQAEPTTFRIHKNVEKDLITRPGTLIVNGKKLDLYAAKNSDGRTDQAAIAEKMSLLVNTLKDSGLTQSQIENELDYVHTTAHVDMQLFLMQQFKDAVVTLSPYDKPRCEITISTDISQRKIQLKSTYWILDQATALIDPKIGLDPSVKLMHVVHATTEIDPEDNTFTMSYTTQ